MTSQDDFPRDSSFEELAREDLERGYIPFPDSLNLDEMESLRFYLATRTYSSVRFECLFPLDADPSKGVVEGEEFKSRTGLTGLIIGSSKGRVGFSLDWERKDGDWPDAPMNNIYRGMQISEDWIDERGNSPELDIVKGLVKEYFEQRNAQMKLPEPSES